MSDTCVIVRPSTTLNALREVVRSDDAAVVERVCTVGDLDGDELIIAQRLDVRSVARLSLPFGTDIHHDDEVTVLGVRYAVTFVYPATAESTSQDADLRRLEGQTALL